MTQQQFYDKMVSRMDKMCGSLDKIARMLEAMQKADAFRNATMLALSDIDRNATATLYKYAEGEKE